VLEERLLLSVLYDESVSGDLSNNQSAPTPLTVFLGTDSIKGTVGSGDIQDWLRLHVPLGLDISSLVLHTYVSTDAQGFTGVQAGTSFVGSPFTASSYLGYAHFGTGATNGGLPPTNLVGTDLLPLMGNTTLASGSQGFTPPLDSGDYTFLIQQQGATTTYQFDFGIGSSPSTAIVLGVQPGNTTAGATLSPAVTVKVEDSNGNVVTTDTSNVTLAIGTNPGGGTLSGTRTVAAVSGIATFSTLSINKAGVGYTLTAADGGLTKATSSAFNITPGTATQLVLGVQPSNTTAGATVSPAVTVKVEDSLGNVVTTDASNVTVAIGTNPGAGTLGGTLTVAASSGVATFSNLTIDRAGMGYTLTAADGAIGSATSSAFNIIATATQIAFGVQPGDTTAGATISPAVTVQLEDSLGNVVSTDSSSVTLAIGANPADGTVEGTVTAAAVSGIATFSNLSINKSGVGYTLTATDGSLVGATSSSFSISPGTGSQVAFGVEPGTTTAGLTINPAVTVEVEDSLGNMVTTDTTNVTVAIGTNVGGGTLSGTTTVQAVSGTATFSTLSINKSGTGYTLTAADGSLTQGTSSTFNITPGTATQVVFAVQPTNTAAGQTISPAVTIQVEDSLGNVVTSDSSYVSVVPGTNPVGGTLGGTTTVRAAAGVAAFTNLAIDAAGTGYTLFAFDSEGLQANSTAFNIVSVASRLVFATQPASATAGSTIAPDVEVLVEDAAGNVVTGDSSSVTVAVGANPGGGTLSGSTTVTATSGVAVFSTLSINKSGNGYTLTAADGGLIGATSSSFNIIPGHANHLAVTASPTTTTAGAGFVLMVTAEDSLGNPDTSYNSTVTFSSSDPLAPTPAAPLALTGGQGFTIGTLLTASTWTVAASGPGASGSSGNIIVQPGSASHLVVTASANPAITGSAFGVTVTAEDLYNNVATGYSGTVSLTSSDAAATLMPNPYPFTAGDEGVHTFSANLNTPGSQTITARDTGNGAVQGISSAIATRGLEVSSVTVTPSGFTLTFNKPFNASVLNLYDGGSSLLGPADLTLTGASNGLITNGSLVVTSPTTLSYIYTFGLLPDDSYTLVLRSATNGFVDNTGVSLDGTNSGIPGNYTTAFTTSYNTSDVGLVVPSFARGPAQSVSLVVPNSSPSVYYPGLPIQLSDGDNTMAATFTLTYNTALLNVTGAQVDTTAAYRSAPAGSTFSRTSHTLVSGMATDVFAFSTNGNGNLGTGGGPVTLGELTATTPNAAGQTIYKAKQVLTVSGVSVTGTLPGVGAGGVQLVAYPADASGDGTYAGNDASLVGRVAGGQDTGFVAYPLVDPVIVADVAGEGVVTGTDASQVAQVAVHRMVPNIDPIPAGAQVLPSTAPDPLLSIPTGLRISASGTVSVPVNLNEARPAGSTGLTEATLALRFDPLEFTVSSSDIHPGSIPQSGSGWTLTSSVDAVTGQIGITLYSLTPIATNLAGSLVTIDFQAQPGAAIGISSIQLAGSVDPNGQGSYVTNVADTNGAMILGIAPTNAVDPRIDGSVVLVTPAPAAVVVDPATPVMVGPIASEAPAPVAAATVVTVSAEQLSGEESPAPALSNESAAYGARTTAGSTAALTNVAFVSLMPSSGSVFLIGVPTAAVNALALAASEAHVTDPVFLAVARGAVDLADRAASSQPVVNLPVTGTLESSPAWFSDLLGDGNDVYGDLARVRSGRRDRGEAVAVAVPDTAALSQYFAQAAANDEVDGQSEE
jgi:hypothetical protein